MFLFHKYDISQCQGHNFDSSFGEKSLFSEYGYITYQIKGNEM